MFWSNACIPPLFVLNVDYVTCHLVKTFDAEHNKNKGLYRFTDTFEVDQWKYRTD